jgi:hypothetical protein
MKRFVPALLALLLISPAVIAGVHDIVLNNYGQDFVLASSLDQPRMTGVLTYNGSVITDAGSPVVLNAFVDTGASSAAVISHLSAVGYTSGGMLGDTTPSLGLDGSPAGQFIGHYTDVGIGGEETGDVTWPLGIRLFNGPIETVDPTTYSSYASQFVDYGQKNLWVRRQAGIGEITNILGFEMVDPVNIVGTPVIQQRVMVMDPRPMANLDTMVTSLLPAGDANIPATNLTFKVSMHDFTGTLRAGETRPTVGNNPLMQNIGLANTPAGSTTKSLANQQWLLDTGSSSTFLSLKTAWALGLVPDGMSLADFTALHKAQGGIVEPIGGVGALVDAPLVTLGEIRLPAANTQDVLVWHNVDVLILDIQGLDGVFGMNLLLPSVTVDPNAPEASLDTISPGYFDSLVFDAAAGQLRVKTGFDLPPVPGDFNGDRRVTGKDFLLWQANYPKLSGATLANGDATGDGRVNGADFLIWQASYVPDTAGPAPVPEPSAAVLMLVFFVKFLRRGTGVKCDTQL